MAHLDELSAKGHTPETRRMADESWTARLGRRAIQHYRLCAAAVLGLAAFNLLFRLHNSQINRTQTERFMLQVLGGFRLDVQSPTGGQGSVLLVDRTADALEGKLLGESPGYRLIAVAIQGR